GGVVLKKGLSRSARGGSGRAPPGPRASPLCGARRSPTRLPRLAVKKPIPLTRDADGNAAFPANLGERPGKRLSYHTDFTANPADPNFINPITHRGPIEGRPPGELFAHQRWDQLVPQAGCGRPLGQTAR